jgi:hypothetical protein
VAEYLRSPLPVFLLNVCVDLLRCLARVLGPSVVSALFAVSIDKGIWGGNLWWIVMVAICTVSAVVGLLVQEKTPNYTQTAARTINEVDEAECYEIHSHRRKTSHSSDESDEDC